MFRRNNDIQIDDQRKNHPDPKRPQKRSCPNNFRPITFLSMMWKVLTALIREWIYYSQIFRKLFSKEQKRCWRGTKGKEDLLYIDQHILKESKLRRKNIAIAEIDKKKNIRYGSTKSDEVIKFIVESLINWWAELTEGEKCLADVKDALPLLSFVIARMQLNHILR